MGEECELTLRPIGRVTRGRPRPDQSDRLDDRWEEQEAEIEIEPAWTEALEGIEGFSHLWLVWRLDQPEGGPVVLQVHPEGRQEMPLVGVFATRSPRRPNPLAITAVRLLEHRGNRLWVQGLDAYEGTSIFDIKPYLRRGDLIAEAVMPEWLERLWCLHDQEKPQGPEQKA